MLRCLPFSQLLFSSIFNTHKSLACNFLLLSLSLSLSRFRFVPFFHLKYRLVGSIYFHLASCVFLGVYLSCAALYIDNHFHMCPVHTNEQIFNWPNRTRFAFARRDERWVWCNLVMRINGGWQQAGGRGPKCFWNDFWQRATEIACTVFSLFHCRFILSLSSIPRQTIHAIIAILSGATRLFLSCVHVRPLILSIQPTPWCLRVTTANDSDFNYNRNQRFVLYYSQQAQWSINVIICLSVFVCALYIRESECLPSQRLNARALVELPLPILSAPTVESIKERSVSFYFSLSSMPSMWWIHGG